MPQIEPQADRRRCSNCGRRLTEDDPTIEIAAGVVGICDACADRVFEARKVRVAGNGEGWRNGETPATNARGITVPGVASGDDCSAG